MKQQHTPGPWTARTVPGQLFEILSPNHNVVLRIRGGMIPNPANAAMMAEAPAMLDELYRLLPFIEDAEKDPAYKPGDVHERTKAIRAILARLAGI